MPLKSLRTNGGAISLEQLTPGMDSRVLCCVFLVPSLLFLAKHQSSVMKEKDFSIFLPLLFSRYQVNKFLDQIVLEY